MTLWRPSLDRAPAMRALALVDRERVEVRDVPVPDVQPDEIRIDVAAAGICGSDLSAWRGHHPFRIPPVVLGHEVSGVIVAVGTDVDPARVGERVAIEPQRLCGVCAHCRAGRNQLCERKVLPGMDGWFGSIAEQFVAPAAMAHPLPDSLDLELAALAEPLAVAVHSVRQGAVESGWTVNVIGAGTIGLLVTLVAASRGASVNLVTDVDEDRLDAARTRGVAETLNARDVDIEEYAAAHPRLHADVTVVAATAPRSLVEATALTKPGGTIVLLGLYGDTAVINASDLVMREQRIVASVTYDSSDFRAAIAMLDARPVVFGTFLTRRIAMEDADEEFSAQASRSRFSLKTLILPRAHSEESR